MPGSTATDAVRLEVRPYRASDRAAVVELWRRCDLTRPWNDPGLDIDRKTTRDPDGFLVGVVDGAVVAVVMAGYDGHRGWINYLAVDPDRRGAGLGAEIMRAAEQHLARLGCPEDQPADPHLEHRCRSVLRVDRLLDGRRRLDGAPPGRRRGRTGLTDLLT